MITILYYMGKEAGGEFIVGKTCGRRSHVCAIFSSLLSYFFVDTQVLFFLHFAVKIDIKDG